MQNLILALRLFTVFLLKYLIGFLNSKAIFIKLPVIKYCLTTSHSHPILLNKPDSLVCILPYFM